MSIGIEYFPFSFDIIILPISFNPCMIGKDYATKSFFFSFIEMSLVDGSITIVVCSLSMSLAIEPHTIISLSIGICHLSPTAFQIIFPITLVNISMSIVVSSPSLFAIFDCSFEALSIVKDINAVN